MMYVHKFLVDVTEENGMYTARCRELGLQAYGSSEDEAMMNLDALIAMYIDDLPDMERYLP